MGKQKKLGKKRRVLCETHLGCLRERSFIMSQREVGLGEEGRFFKMYKMWGDCWAKLKLKQIHVSFNSRQKKIALVWFFLATNGRPRARPLQFCCVPPFNLCTTHSSDNKISILLRHLLKRRLILFLLYFFSSCTPFFMLLRGERRALPSHMPLCYI